MLTWPKTTMFTARNGFPNQVSREVRISWYPFFSVVYFSRGFPSPQKEGYKGTTGGPSKQKRLSKSSERESPVRSGREALAQDVHEMFAGRDQGVLGALLQNELRAARFQLPC